MKNIRTGSVVTEVIMLAAGVIFLICPGGALITAAVVLGIALLLTAAAGIVLPLLGGEGLDMSSLLIPIIEAVVGIIVLAHPSFVISLYPVIMGIIIVLYGVGDILTALRGRDADMGGWQAALLMAAITVLLGIVMLVNPFKTMRLFVRVAGLVLIYKGVTGLLIRRKT